MIINVSANILKYFHFIFDYDSELFYNQQKWGKWNNSNVVSFYCIVFFCKNN